MALNQNILSVVALVALIGMSSCKDDEKTNQYSKTEANVIIDDFNSSAVSDLQELSDVDGVQAIQDLFDLVEADDPFSGRVGTEKKEIRDFFKKKGKEFKSIFVPAKAINGRAASEEPFDFEGNLGVYAWNPDLGEAGEFEKTGNSEIIEIKFPTEGSATNNATLKLTAYSEIEVYDEEWEEYSYQPELLKASLFVNDVKVASLDFEVDWDDAGFPIAGDIVLTINDFKISVSFDTSGSTSSTLSVSLLHLEETLIASTITVKYENSSKSEESLKSIDGFIQLKGLKLQGNVDIKAADAVEVDWNDVFNLSLYSDGKKLGDIVFIEVDTEFVPFLQYADGSKEELETVLQPVIDEIDNLATDLGING